MRELYGAGPRTVYARAVMGAERTMPLPIVAPNNTARLFVDYITGAQPSSAEHTLMCRYDQSRLTASDAADGIGRLLMAIGAANLRAGWKVLRLRNASQGNDFSVPVTMPSAITSFVGTANINYNARLETVEETFQGRSASTGRRVDVSLYRAMADCDASFRVLASGSGVGSMVTAIVGRLNADVFAGHWLAVDGSGPVWSSYMNQNYNSYWERRLRTV